MVRFWILDIRKTEICSESPERENANLFHFYHQGFATEETLTQVVNRIQQDNHLMESFTYQANQSVNQLAPLYRDQIPSTAPHSSFYLPEVSAVLSETVVQGSLLPVFAVILALAERG